MRPASSVILCGIMAISLSACNDTRLRYLTDTSAGPEEFTILPTRELQEPDNYATLPVPTPGQANLVDVNPQADAIAALGGNPARANDTGVARADAALVARASRFGVQGNIREITSEEDAAFRKRQSRFTNIRLFRTDRYAKAYRRELLKPHQALDAYRRVGAETPSAPPGN